MINMFVSILSVVVAVTEQSATGISAFAVFGLGVVLGACLGSVICLKKKKESNIKEMNITEHAAETKGGKASSSLVLHDENWLVGRVLLGCFHNQYDKMNSFLEGVIACSDGEYCAAAQIGEDFDDRKMKSREMLLAGAKVREINFCGLIKTTTGEVVLKADVL